jgi:protein-L-isoaspartate(D-aspartate) O-methyltransferase
MMNIALDNMIKQQLRTGDVLNEDVLSLFEAYPREVFVPQGYKEFAYSDMQIPLAHEQQMMTPLEEGKILEALKLKGNEYVLEVGTGSGYLTTLLAKSSKRLVTVDYFDDFTDAAKQKLEQHGIDNVEFFTGDACRGWMEKAPYDVIVMTGSITEVAKCFKPQLMRGGKLFTVLGQAPAMHGVLLTLNDDDTWHKQILFETNTKPLIDKTKHDSFVF